MSTYDAADRKVRRRRGSHGWLRTSLGGGRAGPDVRVTVPGTGKLPTNNDSRVPDDSGDLQSTSVGKTAAFWAGARAALTEAVNARP
jgi:hypothetical protein